MTAVRVSGVSKAFGPVAVLQGVSLEVAAGEAVAILGPSGCGKTTLLRLVAGLAAPDAGEIALGGRVVSRPGWTVPPHERGIGFVFQAPALWPHMTVLENVAFGVRGRRGAAAREVAASWLARVQLGGLGARYPEQLSGGQAQRVALARALAPDPAVLLMDDPLTHLDGELKAELRELIAAVVADARPTLLYVTHDENELAALVTRRVRMQDGGLIEEGRG